MLEPVEVASILVVTDLEAYEASLFMDRVRAFLTVLDGEAVTWTVANGEDFASVRDLLDLVEQRRPDLICTYRNLRTEAWRWPFTLGDDLEVLTQATTTPVLVLPHPRAAEDGIPAGTGRVMAITDHLTGEHRLVNYAARCTAPGGTLTLTHVEDDVHFARVIDVISKIPEIDTDLARTEIRRRLLKEPHDYIGSCAEVLAAAGMDTTVAEIVTLGHRLSTYTQLVEEHNVDLLVMHTKDEDQLAMHGLAYPLAVELRATPMLML